MSRKKKYKNKREEINNNIESTIIVKKLTNYIMIDGKKNKAINIINKAISKLNTIKNKNCITVLKEAIKNIRPKIEVKTKRIGGATYRIPIEIKQQRSIFLALKWLVLYSRKRRTENNIINKIHNEIIDAYYKKGQSYKKKEEMHKIAESNKAFSHYKC